MGISRSVIAEKLVTGYRQAVYRVDTGHHCIDLRIDQYSESLAQFLGVSAQSCAALISAYNPHSHQVSDRKNLAAHRLLQDCLQQSFNPVHSALNIDPSGVWPPEASLFVPGLDSDTARSLGQQFNQNAIVCINDDAIPRLILLR